MNMILNSDEIDFAIQAYLAFRGFETGARLYEKNGYGEFAVLCTDVKRRDADENKLIEKIKSR